MELVVFLLVVFVIWLFIKVGRLTERIQQLDRQVLNASDEIQALRSHAVPRSAASAAAPVTAAPQPPAPPPPPTPAVVTRDMTPGPISTAGPTTSPGPTPTQTPAPAPGKTTPDLVSQPPKPLAAPKTTPDLVSEPRESWEITVGTAWLNRIGVLTLVIGVALSVRYSFPLMGPEGRIAIGYALSGVILGAGVWLERRDAFRNYGYGLIAGGWAGIYFTTFAMHDVPAARVIDSDLLAVSLLLTVATGMIAHSLKYRSQVVTSLAFVVAYSTLGLSPLSGFSLAASVPLAMALLVVSQRLGWPAISVLGIAATYGVFILRSQVFPGGAMDPGSTLPYVTLATYWLTFEAADLIGLRLRKLDSPAGAPFQVSMLALNAAGFLGSIVVISPGTHPELRSTLMFATGAAYIVSAVIRAWLLPERRAVAEVDRPFDVSHAATAMASLLFGIGILLRFRGVRIPLGWLLETQLLFVAGLTLSDRWIRRMASIVAPLATVGTALCLIGRGRFVGLPTEAVATILVALTWYANREWLRIKSLPTAWLEPGYTWAASAMLVIAAWTVFLPAHFGLVCWILALALLETGLRRDHEYTVQSYGAGAIAGYATLLAFLAADADGALAGWGPGPTPADDWLVLPAAIAICAFSAHRLLRFSGPHPVPVARGAAGTAAALGAVLTMVLEWRVLSPNAIAPAWAMTGLALVAFGSWKSYAAPRWLGYVITLSATLRQIGPLLDRAPESTPEIAAGAVVIAAMYAASYLGGRASEAKEKEKVSAALLTVAATASLALWKYRVLPEELVAPAWVVTGMVLVALGFYRRRLGQRWQGYAVLAFGVVHACGPVFGEGDATRTAITWLVGCLMATYATALSSRRFLKESALSDQARDSENTAITGFLAAASTTLAAVIVTQARPSLATLMLAMQGLGVMTVGLAVRERVMRLSGMTLLLGCLLKVFLYDLRELEPLPRIFSFVVLGLVLLGISWIYTRYKEQIRKLL